MAAGAVSVEFPQKLDVEEGFTLCSKICTPTQLDAEEGFTLCSKRFLYGPMAERRRAP